MQHGSATGGIRSKHVFNVVRAPHFRADTGWCPAPVAAVSEFCDHAPSLRQLTPVAMA
jgi:hypothetical protein